jgi:hypothetical protein
MQNSVELLWPNMARPFLRQVAGIAHLVFCKADLELLHGLHSDQSYAAKSDKSASGDSGWLWGPGKLFVWAPRRPSTSNLQASFQYPVGALSRFLG